MAENNPINLRLAFSLSFLALNEMVDHHLQTAEMPGLPFFMGTWKSNQYNFLAAIMPTEKLREKFAEAANAASRNTANEMIAYLDEEGYKASEIYAKLPDAIKTREALEFAEKNDLPYFADVLRRNIYRPV
jgi:hypothetical protein